MKCDIWHVTCDKCHITHDMWHLTCDTWIFHLFSFSVRFYPILDCFYYPQTAIYSVSPVYKFSYLNIFKQIKQAKTLPHFVHIHWNHIYLTWFELSSIQNTANIHFRNLFRKENRNFLVFWNLIKKCYSLKSLISQCPLMKI